ncbi:MAG TPA: DUF4230 domain-containing protein [Candidatus Intestinimonas merdavium]|uniref:DUF4230 domain-containing protein n=1 Tax=Candidatus Intestinimonas merdavium TaxID=2838622 RepID=A0A9D1Z2J1_9FIRM|nr:DUF4230 domain-containing protein [Candidatus Intestinimonas merdavium]
MAETKTHTLPRLKRRLFWAAGAVLLLLLAFWLGALWRGREQQPVITSDLLGQQLQTVQELVSVEYHYTNMGKFENQVDFYGWKVPFTTKRFLVSYDGLIKAGVDLSGATVEVDEVQKSVTITLPESRILSHEIPEDSIQVFDETRNIFNPITIEDYTGFTRDQKAEVEQRAIDEGLLTGASEKAREAVETLAALLPGSGDYTWTIR